MSVLTSPMLLLKKKCKFGEKTKEMKMWTIHFYSIKNKNKNHLDLILLTHGNETNLFTHNFLLSNIVVFKVTFIYMFLL